MRGLMIASYKWQGNVNLEWNIAYFDMCFVWKYRQGATMLTYIYSRT